MDQAAAQAIFDRFLRDKEELTGEPLGMYRNGPERCELGWGFGYQSKAYLETGEFGLQLVGHGAVVVLDDGRILEGGSLHPLPSDVLRLYGLIK